MFVGHKQKGIVCDATNGSFTKGGGGELGARGGAGGGSNKLCLPIFQSVLVTLLAPLSKSNKSSVLNEILSRLNYWPQ